MKDMSLKEKADLISFRQLRLFESVGRLASVRRGSEECNLSQPAVTQSLSKLEQQLNVILFERRASGSYLTEEGKIFHLRAQRLFSQIEVALIDLGVSGGQLGAVATANRISRSQARSLIAIIEHGSFSKAALALGLTQASLQRAARDLEGNLRKSICHRAVDGVMVMPDGIEFGRKLKLATQEVEWGIREIEAARGVHESQIIIGALPFGGSVLLASVLEEFVSSHGNADVKIVIEGASEMIKRLRIGEVDLVVGILQETTAQDLANKAFARTQYEIVVRRNHPLTQKAEVTLDDLTNYDWVVGTEGSSRRECFDTLFAGRSTPRSPIATSSLPIIRHMLAGSDRLTVMTSYELEHEGNALESLPLGLCLPSPGIGITIRADWLPTRLHQDFIDLLRHRVTNPSI